MRCTRIRTGVGYAARGESVPGVSRWAVAGWNVTLRLAQGVHAAKTVARIDALVIGAHLAANAVLVNYKNTNQRKLPSLL